VGAAIAAATTYVAAILGRGFEMFESAAGEVNRAMTTETNGTFESHDDARIEARA
jgi:hypothetical protein